jgi:hypothetical protein
MHGFWIMGERHTAGGHKATIVCLKSRPKTRRDFRQTIVHGGHPISTTIQCILMRM